MSKVLDLEKEEKTASAYNAIKGALDRSLKKARRLQSKGAVEDFPNILVVGDAGCGKTSIIRKWAEENGINLCRRSLSTMGAEAFCGVTVRDTTDPRYATRIGSNEFINELSKPNSVLFLDEYNRAKTEIRGNMLTLIQEHLIWDPTSDSGNRFLNNFLFTVVAINPSDSNYKGAKELDPAELSRFYTVFVEQDPAEHFDYLKDFYSKELESEEDEEERVAIMGRMALAESICKCVDFNYDTKAEIDELFGDPKYKPLNYRSFKEALDYSDGTRDDFLEIFDHYCNYKKHGIVENALKTFTTVDDKATQAIENDSESEVFKTRQSNRDLLKAKYPELNI